MLLLTGPNYSGKSVYLKQAGDPRKRTHSRREIANFNRRSWTRLWHLEYLLSLDHANPKVLAATHFRETFEQKCLLCRPQLALGHMNILVNETSSAMAHQIIYLYK